MSDEELIAAVRANYEHGRGATFEETEALFAALDATERERDAARAERDEARAKLSELAGRYNGALIAIEQAENDPRIHMGQACLDWCHDTGRCHFCPYSDGGIPHDDDCPMHVAALDAHTKANP